MGDQPEAASHSILWTMEGGHVQTGREWMDSTLLRAIRRRLSVT